MTNTFTIKHEMNPIFRNEIKDFFLFFFCWNSDVWLLYHTYQIFDRYVLTQTDSQAAKHSGTYITHNVALYDRLMLIPLLIVLFCFIFFFCVEFHFFLFTKYEIEVELLYKCGFVWVVYVVCWVNTVVTLLTPVYIFRLIFIEFPFCDYF